MTVRFELGKRSNRVKLCSNAQTNPRPNGISMVFPACALTNSLSLPLAHRQDPFQQNASPALQAQPVTEVHPQHRSDTQTLHAGQWQCLHVSTVSRRHIAAPLFGDAALHASQRAEPRQVPQNSPKRSGSDPYIFLTFLWTNLSLFHHMFPFTLENLRQKGMWTQDWSCTLRQLRCFLEFLPSCQPRHKWILPVTEFSVILQPGTLFSEGIGTIENVLNPLYHISSWQSLTSLPLSASSCAKSSASRSYVEIGTLWVC